MKSTQLPVDFEPCTALKKREVLFMHMNIRLLIEEATVNSGVGQEKRSKQGDLQALRNADPRILRRLIGEKESEKEPRTSLLLWVADVDSVIPYELMTPGLAEAARKPLAWQQHLVCAAATCAR